MIERGIYEEVQQQRRDLEGSLNVDGNDKRLPEPLQLEGGDDLVSVLRQSTTTTARRGTKYAGSTAVQNRNEPAIPSRHGTAIHLHVWKS